MNVLCTFSSLICKDMKLIFYSLFSQLEADGQTVPTELRKQEAARVDPKVQEMRGKRDTVIRAQGVR